MGFFQSRKIEFLISELKKVTFAALSLKKPSKS
jgi:hypothetical protein